MLAFCIVLSVFIKNCAATIDILQHPLKSCNVGDVVQNECTKCVCTSKAIFECTAIDCHDSKIVINEVEEVNKKICHPNQVYVQNLITCICTKDGRWPHKSCYDTFKALPPKNVIKHKCEPDTYVVVDCNLCRCGPFGEILNNRCTKNVCDEDSGRRESRSSSVFGSCEVKNWYSLAPCQFCYCVQENRLVCNTGNHYLENLELGTYNLRVCGPELIKEAIELIPENEQALRLGLRIENDSITTPNVIEVQTTHDVTIDIKKVESEANVYGKGEYVSNEKEYYSETEEDKPGNTSEVTKVAVSTQNPYQEGDETEEDPSKSNEYEKDDDATNEITLDMTSEPKLKEKHKVSEAETKEIPEPLSAFSETLKINLPKVLNKVFQLALRKSMVSLNAESKCVPGMTSMKDCNMCFCLKNSKLLCTNNKC